MKWPTEPFVVGANLPWIDYGCDFGANAWFPNGGLGHRPDAMARFERALDRLVTDGLSLVRLFVLCDGRAGIRFDEHDIPLGLDEALIRDADAAFGAAEARQIGVMPVLFDFHLCRRGRTPNGVRIGGRRVLIADGRMRDCLLERVVAPLAERYGEHPAIAAWDLFNEPEWCTWPAGAGSDIWPIPARRMRESLGELLGCLRDRVRQPVTVGLAGATHFELVRGLGLDFYQVHWYEPSGWPALASPVSRFGLDAPVLLGEFPGRLDGATPGGVVEAARLAGYCGALVWSMAARDDVSAYPEGLAAVAQAAASHPPAH